MSKLSGNGVEGVGVKTLGSVEGVGVESLGSVEGVRRINRLGD